MYKKKISGAQFTLDCINKEFEIIGSSNHWDTFEELCQWTQLEENRKWYCQNEFTTPEQYYEWKAYFMEHFYDWQPKRVSKTTAKREFGWFNLMYGFKYAFDYRLLNND